VTNESWQWHDTRAIDVKRQPGRYEVGIIDLYADVDAGDVGGRYLPLASFRDQQAARSFSADIEHDAITADTPWRSAQVAEYVAYDQITQPTDDLDHDFTDPAFDPLLAEAFRLGGLYVPEPQPAQEALDAIGVHVADFDPAQRPMFYDEASATAYWIGVFQPDPDDRENCVTSILSLGRDPESGAMEAQLAPCAVADWDTAYANADYLIQKAQTGGIENAFDAADAMARGAQQRSLWESERGVALPPTVSQNLSDYTQETFTR